MKAFADNIPATKLVSPFDWQGKHAWLTIKLPLKNHMISMRISQYFRIEHPRTPLRTGWPAGAGFDYAHTVEDVGGESIQASRELIVHCEQLGVVL